MTPLASNQTNNEARDAIMQSIRAHLAESLKIDSIQPLAPSIADEPSPAIAMELSRVTTFCQQLEAVGGYCVIVKNEDEAAGVLVDVVSRLQASTTAKRIALS